MALYTDIMTNGATQASKQINRLQGALMMSEASQGLAKGAAEIQAQAVAKLMGIGEKIDVMV